MHQVLAQCMVLQVHLGRGKSANLIYVKILFTMPNQWKMSAPSINDVHLSEDKTRAEDGNLCMQELGNLVL